jgi:hypothetical protein
MDGMDGSCQILSPLSKHVWCVPKRALSRPSGTSVICPSSITGANWRGTNDLKLHSCAGILPCCLIATAFHKFLSHLDTASVNTYREIARFILEGAMGLQGLFLFS